MKSFKRWTAAAVVLIAGVTGLAACGSSTSKSSTSSTPKGSSAAVSSAPSSGIPAGPVTVGMPIALTGPISIFDSDMLVGAKVEANQLNAGGGVDGHKIKIVTADTASNIAQGSSAALQTIQEGARFIIPTLDYNYGGGAARTAVAKNLIAISGAADPRFGLSIGKSMFNLYSGADTEGASMAQYDYSTLGWRKAYVIYDSSLAEATDVCQSFVSSFKQLGGQVVGTDTVEATDTSIAPQVTRLREAQSSISGVAFCTYPPSGTSFLRQMRAGGITKSIQLDQAMDGNNWESGLPNLNGLYAVSVGPLTPGQDPDPAQAKLFAASAKLTGKPNQFALGLLVGSSAVQAIAAGIKHTNSENTQKIEGYWQTFKNYPLIIGDTTWSATCHQPIGRRMFVVKFAQGHEVYVKTVTASNVPASACAGS